MYSSVPNSDEKSASGPMIAQDSTKTGTPVNKTNQFYRSKNSRSSSPLQSKNKEPWSTGLCDCFSDCPNCCMTLWCPCVTFAQIADIVDQGSSSYGVNVALYTLMLCVTGNACWYSCFYRGEIRELYALKESPCEDCLVHCFCEYCALCQEYRELKTRGYDLSIGWHGNAEKKNRSLEMASEAPPIEGAMSR